MKKEYRNINGTWKLVDVIVYVVYYTTKQGMQKLNVAFSNVSEGATGLMKLAQLLLTSCGVEHGSIIVAELKK